MIIVTLCLVAITPLLRADSPCTHDGSLHYYRVAAMRDALQDGILFSRYLPGLAFGYGYPFFNYRAALSYYLALVLHVAGLGLPVALNLVYVLSIVGSALSAYLLARDLFGLRAGIVAAVAYAYAPYQFLDALLRANAPESIALALFPLILWAFRRLALTGHRRWFLVSVGSLTALYLTHNISSLLFTPLLAAYLAVLWLVHRRAGHWKETIGALAASLGITAFLWGPALLEKNYVQINRSITTRNNDFHYNFISLAEVFAPPTPMDTSLMNPPMRIHLGLVQAILAGIGFVTGLIRWRERERRAHLLFFALTTVTMIGMSTHTSLWLWEHVPLLPFVQFPWRFIGRAALPTALLAGASVPGLAGLMPCPSNTQRFAPRCLSQVSRALPLVIPVSLLILSAFPATYPPQGYCSAPSQPSISDVFAYERQSKLVGVDPEGSYFPIWVKHVPEGSPLEEQFIADGPITRFDETVLPQGAAILEADYGPNRARIIVETPSSFQARYLAFYFPGWRVTLDGNSVPITPTDPEGLISFNVPAGRHAIDVRFGSTSLRRWSMVISALSFAALSLGLFLGIPSSPRRTLLPPHSPHYSLISSALVALALLAFKTAYVDHHDTVFRRPALQHDGSLRDVQVPLHINFDDQLVLLGYDVQPTPGVKKPPNSLVVRANEQIELVLYWRTARPLNTDHMISFQLVDDQGRCYGQKDAGHQTHIWRENAYARDLQQLSVWPGTPPGEYTLQISVSDAPTGRKLDVRGPTGARVGTTYALSTVQVTRATHPPDLDSMAIAHRIKADMGGGLRLIGFDAPPSSVNAGDPILLTLYWQAETAPPENYTTRLSLVAPDGAVIAKVSAIPGKVDYPTSHWLAGDVIRDGRRLIVPAPTPTGEYTLHVELLDAAGSSITPSDWNNPLPPSEELREPSRAAGDAGRAKGIELLTITVHAPERTFDPPPILYPITATLDGQATLLGYDLDNDTLAPGQTFTLTLYWQAEATTETGYAVFVHLLDEAERIYAQSDRAPAAGTRPTTGWLPGEVIHDAHTLTLAPDAPPGQYILEVGMYDPASRERLPVLDEHGVDTGDHILLPIRLSVLPSVDALP